MKKKISITLIVVLGAAWLSAGAQAVEHFRGGVRIPAGSCVIYHDLPGSQVSSFNGGLKIFNLAGPVKEHCVCQVPVPEKARIRKFVMVGNVTKGEIFSYIAGVPRNQPNQVPIYAHLSLMPSTPFEIPAAKQKKVETTLPVSGSESLIISRFNTYFIEAEYKSNKPLAANEALEVFYFEIYWD